MMNDRRDSTRSSDPGIAQALQEGFIWHPPPDSFSQKPSHHIPLHTPFQHLFSTPDLTHPFSTPDLTHPINTSSHTHYHHNVSTQPPTHLLIHLTTSLIHPPTHPFTHFLNIAQETYDATKKPVQVDTKESKSRLRKFVRLLHAGEGNSSDKTGRGRKKQDHGHRRWFQGVWGGRLFCSILDLTGLNIMVEIDGFIWKCIRREDVIGQGRSEEISIKLSESS